MKNYLVLLRGGTEGYDALTEEERQGLYQKWGAYVERLTTGGHWIKGNPLGKDGRILNRDAGASEGVVMEGGPVGGFMLLEAETYDHAVELCKECPSLVIGSALEIREAVEM